MQETGQTLPINDLHLRMMMTEPDWGKTIPKALERKLSQTMEINFTKDGKFQSFTYNDVAWELLSFYKKEMRLANLTSLEMVYCQWYIDYAGDVLVEDQKVTFLTSLRRAITILELTQSKKGFLRKLFTTKISQEYAEVVEPKKKGMFGQNKKESD